MVSGASALKCRRNAGVSMAPPTNRGCHCRGCQIVYMEHTGCRVVTAGWCQIGYMLAAPAVIS
jgi:hypothetical protein